MDKQEGNIYRITKKEDTIEVAGKLNEALASGNDEQVLEILKDPEKIHGMVIRLGEAGSNLKLLERAFNSLLKTRFGVVAELSEFEEGRGAELIGFIKEMGLPEQILTEMSECAFYAGDEKKFFKILKLIYLNQEHFQNQQVVARAIHDMASWQGTHHNKEAAVALNQEALGLARKTDDEILSLKSQAGLSINKELPPRLRADDLIRLAENLKGKGVEYDAARLRIEAAAALLDLAKRQTGSLREENLVKAKKLALEQGLKDALEIDYPKAEIVARKVLADIYKEFGEKKKSLSYAEGAKKRKRFVKGV